MKLEINSNNAESKNFKIGKSVIMAGTPGMQENWTFKVQLTENQAIVGFSKFMQIGIGFLVEDENGNTNLPSHCTAKKIFDWIEVNKGDDSITEETCIKAINMVKKAAKQMEEAEKQAENEIAMANEPWLKGENGKIISQNFFNEHSHVATYGRGNRKRFNIMSKYQGNDGNGWEYKISVQCGRGSVTTKAQALKFARMLMIEFNTTGRDSYWGSVMTLTKNKDGMKVPVCG